MEEDDDTIFYHPDEEIQRAADWDGDLDTLEDLAHTIRSALKEREMDIVEAMCDTLLAKMKLPLFTRGRFNAYLSLVEGQDRARRLDEATFWLNRAGIAVKKIGINNDETITRWKKHVAEARGRLLQSASEDGKPFLNFHISNRICDSADSDGCYSTEGPPLFHC